MNNWAAPLTVAIVSTVGAFLVQEPGAAIIGYCVAAMGYGINKAASK